jgi:hypothetical protein
MNAIGKIGAIIIKYQYQIEIALLSLLALIVLIGLIKLIISALRRKDVLSEIKVTVTDIDSTVKEINQKQEVLIEGSLASSGETAKKAEPDNNCDIVKVEDKTEATDLKAEQAPEVATEEKASESTLAEALPEQGLGFGEDKRFENVLENLLIKNRDGDVHCAEDGEVSKKFASRECGTDKHGNVYTEEFLSKQIK